MRPRERKRLRPERSESRPMKGMVIPRETLKLAKKIPRLRPEAPIWLA